jgi:hypothetical protein
LSGTDLSHGPSRLQRFCFFNKLQKLSGAGALVVMKSANSVPEKLAKRIKEGPSKLKD